MKTGHSKRPPNRQIQYKDVGVDRLNGWQPIETAPRDGTWILVTGGRADFDDYLDSVINGVGFPMASVVFAEYDEIQNCYDWNLCYWDSDWRTQYINPTHWMPLPTPPKENND